MKIMTKVKRLFNKENTKQSKIDNVFLDMCDKFAELSHCVSYQVATILTINNRIISSGINGTISGSKNCDQIFNKKKFNRKKHHKFSKINEVHSELNAILDAARRGISINGSTAYVNLEPCFECSKNLAMSGIKRIVFRKKYDMNQNIKKQIKERNKYLKRNGVKIEQIK